MHWPIYLCIVYFLHYTFSNSGVLDSLTRLQSMELPFFTCLFGRVLHEHRLKPQAPNYES